MNDPTERTQRHYNTFRMGNKRAKDARDFNDCLSSINDVLDALVRAPSPSSSSPLLDVGNEGVPMYLLKFGMTGSTLYLGGREMEGSRDPSR